MNRTITLATLFGVILLLTGCATMNEDECRSADWYSVGFEDGAHGRPVTYIGNHREACAEYGISPRAGRYQDGWNKGIRRYCTPRNGYQVGMRGSSLRIECPAAQAHAFRSAYQYGKRIYYLNRELSDIDRDVRSREKELEQVQMELAQLDKQLMGEDHRDKEQNRLHKQLRQLYRQEADIEAQLAALDRATRRKTDKQDDERDNNKEDDEHSGREKDRDRTRDKEREKDNERDKDNNRDNDHRKKDSVPRNKGSDKNPKELERELAKVRREIRSLEAKLDRLERQQSNWKLLQRGRQLSLKEGQLLAQLDMLHVERMDIEREISWLKQHAPY